MFWKFHGFTKKQLDGGVQTVLKMTVDMETNFGFYFGCPVTVKGLDVNWLDDVVGALLFADFSTYNSYETGKSYNFYQYAKTKDVQMDDQQYQETEAVNKSKAQNSPSALSPEDPEDAQGQGAKAGLLLLKLEQKKRRKKGN